MSSKICVSLPPMCWDWRHVPPLQLVVILRKEERKEGRKEGRKGKFYKETNMNVVSRFLA